MAILWHYTQWRRFCFLKSIKKNIMYKQPKKYTTTISVNNSYAGETIEQKVDRIINNNEPITDGAPIIYTNRKEGVLPEYDIRTDRFEIAVEATDILHKSHLAKREERAKLIGIDEQTKSTKDGGPEPIQGTNGNADSK